MLAYLFVNAKYVHKLTRYMTPFLNTLPPPTCISIYISSGRKNIMSGSIYSAIEVPAAAFP